MTTCVRSLRLGLLVAMTVLLLNHAGYAQTTIFMGLGDLPGGSVQSEAWAISADGAAIVGNSTGANGTEAFRWTMSSGMGGLGDLPDGIFSSSAIGVSADGAVVVGGSWGASGPEAFRWTLGGGMVGLGDLPGGSFKSGARGVSADGATVVGYGTGELCGPDSEAFRWTSAGGMVGLGDLPGDICVSSASGVSDDGLIVVGYSRGAAGSEAFRWTSGSGIVGLGDLPGGVFESFANGISGDGSTIVGRSKSGDDEAYRWTSGGGMTGLGHLPVDPARSMAWAVSADGTTVVGTSADNKAIVWDATHGMRELRVVLTNLGIDLSGWSLINARDVSDDGRHIIGDGINPQGKTEAWMAVLGDPPYAAPSVSPLSMVLTASLLGATAIRRLRISVVPGNLPTAQSLKTRFLREGRH